MELKYITFSELLREKLALLGFKRKGKDEFLREVNGFVHSIGFCHSSSIPHFRSYYIMIGLSYPKLEDLAMDLGVYYAGAWGVTIGQLTPKNNFQQWLVENSATEEDVRDTVIDMVNLIEAYAVPFLNKYSDINEILFELEEGNRLVPRYAGYNLPLLYYMLGEKENAISYINQELTKKESQAKRSHEGNPLELPHNNSICETPLDREYNEYKEFVKRFMDRIKQ